MAGGLGAKAVRNDKDRGASEQEFRSRRYSRPMSIREFRGECKSGLEKKTKMKGTMNTRSKEMG